MCDEGCRLNNFRDGMMQAKRYWHNIIISGNYRCKLLRLAGRIVDERKMGLEASRIPLHISEIKFTL